MPAKGGTGSAAEEEAEEVDVGALARVFGARLAELEYARRRPGFDPADAAAQELALKQAYSRLRKK